LPPVELARGLGDIFGAVAQLVERIVRNDEVACSTHVRSTSKTWLKTGVAEYLPPSGSAAGRRRILGIYPNRHPRTHHADYPSAPLSYRFFPGVRVPKYREHAASEQARVTLSGKTYDLGKFKSPESEAEYRRVVSESLAMGRLPFRTP
jgi:hypothetical protein